MLLRVFESMTIGLRHAILSWRSIFYIYKYLNGAQTLLQTYVDTYNASMERPLLLDSRRIDPSGPRKSTSELEVGERLPEIHNMTQAVHIHRSRDKTTFNAVGSRQNKVAVCEHVSYKIKELKSCSD